MCVPGAPLVYGRLVGESGRPILSVDREIRSSELFHEPLDVIVPLSRLEIDVGPVRLAVRCRNGHMTAGAFKTQAALVLLRYFHAQASSTKKRLGAPENLIGLECGLFCVSRHGHTSLFRTMS